MLLLLLKVRALFKAIKFVIINIPLMFKARYILFLELSKNKDKTN